MTRTFSLLLFLIVFTGSPANAAGDDFDAVGGVQRLTPQLDALLPEGAHAERLTPDTFTWSEGPVWVPDGSFLLFSDVPEATLWKWSESGGLEVFLKPSWLDDGRERDPAGSGSNGLLLGLDGALLAADHGSRSLVAMDLATRARAVRAGHYEGKRFNSPNDLAISRTRWPGTLFFTDPPYGLTGQDDSPLKELDFNGVYRIDPDGTVTLLDGSMGRPNGIVLSPDERTLYVANSQKEHAVWLAFDLDETGGVAGEPRLFFSAQDRADAGARGLPDGMAMDVHGNLWATGPGGVLVIGPDGQLLGVIETGSAIANCAFGGPGGNVLYMTSHRFLARIETTTKGAEFR